MSILWRLHISDPAGTFKGVQEMGVIRLDGHPMPEAEGDGNCRDCVFVGDAATLGIGPRDLVRVQWSEDAGAHWRTRYTGIAVQTGSPLQPGTSSFRLTGPLKKLEEAEARLPLAKGDLGVQAQQLISDTLASGQWDALFPPTISLEQVPAVTSGAIIPNYQSVATVFKEKLCKRLAKSRVAVNGEGQIVFGVPTGTLLLDEATAGVVVAWQEVVSEDLITDVRWQWTTGMNASFYLAQASDPPGPTPKLDPGSPPVYSTLRSTADQPGGARPYGTGIRTEGVPLDAADFTSLTLGSVTCSSSGSGFTTQGSLSGLFDDDVTTAVTLSADFSTTTGSTGYSVQQTLNVTRLPAGFKIQADQNVPFALSLLLNKPGGGYASLTCTVNQHHVSGLLLFPDTVAAAANAVAFTSITVLLFFTTKASLTLRACAPVAPNDNLDLAARSMRRVPSPSAGSVTAPGWLDPHPMVQIQRRGPNLEDLGIIELPATLYRFEPGGLIAPGVNTAVALQTTIQLGQPDPAESMGIAALIKARDRQATLRAITVAS